MKRLIYCFIGVLVLAPYSGAAESIYTMIIEGQLMQAADSLSALSTASSRDGDNLYFASLLEPDAVQAAKLMEASLNAAVSPVYREDIYFKLAQYYLLQSDYRSLSEIIRVYRSRWEDGRYIGEMTRYEALVEEMNGKYDQAVRTTDRYLLLFSHGDEAAAGNVDKARIMVHFNKKVGARELLRDLARDKRGPSVSQALYMLAMDAIGASRTDDAVFYYNLLREGYPSAIGLATIIDRMMVVSITGGSDTRAEQLTGTYYSIQLGVFSEKGNAKRMADRFKVYDMKVDIGNKTISGVKYHVVYLGKFQNYADAQKFKDELESRHGELYQVVAR